MEPEKEAESAPRRYTLQLTAEQIDFIAGGLGCWESEGLAPYTRAFTEFSEFISGLAVTVEGLEPSDDH